MIPTATDMPMIEAGQRDAFRLDIDPAQAICCYWPGPSGGDQPLPLMNLSVAGLALSADAELPATTDVLNHCRITLPSAGEIYVDLQVCQLTPLPRGDWRVGCRFIDLPPQTERLIQTWIFRVQRQRLGRQP
ncbi:hypothetical protein JCM19000A_40700 [Silvimonas sp. JCM 19000]